MPSNECSGLRVLSATSYNWEEGMGVCQGYPSWVCLSAEAWVCPSQHLVIEAMVVGGLKRKPIVLCRGQLASCCDLCSNICAFVCSPCHCHNTSTVPPYRTCPRSRHQQQHQPRTHNNQQQATTTNKRNLRPPK